MEKTQSPKSYLKNNIFEKIGNIQKKKKIKNDEFKILKIGEHEKLKVFQYNIKQLKIICKFYNLKKTGNKDEIITKIYNFLKFSLYSIKIQRVFRGYLLRQYIKYSGLRNKNRSVCVNSTDFATLEPLQEIPYNQFFCFTDNKNNKYGCNIISLYGLLMENDKKIKEIQPLNPYNREEFCKSDIENYISYLKLAKICKIEHEYKEKKIQLDPIKELEFKILELFQYINSLGNYANSNWLTNLSRNMMVLFIRELYDIWNYRAQLTPQIMREIVPPHGNPFIEVNLHLAQRHDDMYLLNSTVKIIELLVKSGNTNENRSLGAYYVLAALTLVSEDARNSLPWLFQSVAH